MATGGGGGRVCATPTHVHAAPPQTHDAHAAPQRTHVNPTPTRSDNQVTDAQHGHGQHGHGHGHGQHGGEYGHGHGHGQHGGEHGHGHGQFGAIPGGYGIYQSVGGGKGGYGMLMRDGDMGGHRDGCGGGGMGGIGGTVPCGTVVGVSGGTGYDHGGMGGRGFTAVPIAVARPPMAMDGSNSQFIGGMSGMGGDFVANSLVPKAKAMTLPNPMPEGTGGYVTYIPPGSKGNAVDPTGATGGCIGSIPRTPPLGLVHSPKPPMVPPPGHLLSTHTRVAHVNEALEKSAGPGVPKAAFMGQPPPGWTPY